MDKLRKSQGQPVGKTDFSTIVILFIISAFSFSVAIGYNNFVQAFIKEYKLGDGLMIDFLNLVILLLVTVAMLRIIYNQFPEQVEDIVD